MMMIIGAMKVTQLAAPQHVRAHQRHGGQAAQRCHLQRRVGARRRLEHCVHAAEHREGRDHRHDRAQVSVQGHE
jgi:hypothetical protein